MVYVSASDIRNVLHMAARILADDVALEAFSHRNQLIGAKLMTTFDMRWPSRPDFDDAICVTVCRRSLFNRLHAVAWLLFSNWSRRS